MYQPNRKKSLLLTYSNLTNFPNETSLKISIIKQKKKTYITMKKKTKKFSFSIN